jgi:Flp pilus assembly pilin Flp
MDANTSDSDNIRSRWSRARAFARRLHRDESGVAATEYIIVFTLITFGATLAVIATAAFVKAYRDFLVWWFAHPAI